MPHNKWTISRGQNLKKAIVHRILTICPLMNYVWPLTYLWYPAVNRLIKSVTFWLNLGWWIIWPSLMVIKHYLTIGPLSDLWLLIILLINNNPFIPCGLLFFQTLNNVKTRFQTQNGLSFKIAKCRYDYVAFIWRVVTASSSYQIW